MGLETGAPTRLRFTWDVTDPGTITWRNEMAVGDRSWFLIEEYAMVPAEAPDAIRLYSEQPWRRA